MKRISELFCNSVFIFTKKHFKLRKRFAIFGAYVWIVLKRFLRRFRFLPLNYEKHRLLGHTIEFDNFGDFYWTFVEVFVDEDYYFVAHNAQPEVFDCGGNIGVTTLYLKYLYPDARVTIFEPLENNLVYLRKKIAGLSGVRLVEKAVGNTKGSLKIFGDRRAATIQEGLIAKQNKREDEYAGKETSIEIDKASTYLDDVPLDLLKLDIEGAEGDVLEDLEDAGKLGQVKQIAMEYHRYSFEENRLSRIIELLERHRFDVFCQGDFPNLATLPKREYYNFMLYATQRN